MSGKRTLIGAAATAAMLAACTPAAEEQANQPVAQTPKAKAPHCFFKDSETKGWAVRVAGGKAVVTGQAFRSDARYKAVLGEPEIAGEVVSFRPAIAINDTGFAADGNWWDVKGEVPVEGLETVEVRCGAKVIASLPVSG